MKYIEKYLEEELKLQPLGNVGTKEDEVCDLSGEMVYVDGKCTNIFVAHVDYANWLEKKIKL